MKDIKEITARLEEGVKGVFDSEKYREYLSFMGKFHRYSINNSILIWIQKPDASYVAGYKAWQTKFNRNVRKGEKGIHILAPCPHKIVKPITDAQGNLVEEREINYMTYRPTTVFDISQTDGDEVPGICDELTGDVENFDSLMDKLKAVSPVSIEYEDIENGALGYFDPVGKRIAVKTGMSQLQTIKTAIHEVAHAILHDRENGEAKDSNRETKEVQAESVAFTVCTMLGIDTEGYSFEYVANWSTGREVKELVASMEIIRKTANFIVEGVAA